MLMINFHTGQGFIYNKTLTCVEVYTSTQVKVLKPWTGGSINFPPVQGFSEKINLDLYGSIYFPPVQGFSEKITLTCVEVSHLIINTHEHYILAPSTNP